MTQPTDIRPERPAVTRTHRTGGGGTSEPLHTALSLAADGLPVLPLRKGKVPFGNCPACAKNACGGRPNMKIPGPCTCPHPCHGWAAATTDLGVINSSTWGGSGHR